MILKFKPQKLLERRNIQPIVKTIDNLENWLHFIKFYFKLSIVLSSFQFCIGIIIIIISSIHERQNFFTIGRGMLLYSVIFIPASFILIFFIKLKFKQAIDRQKNILFKFLKK